MVVVGAGGNGPWGKVTGAQLWKVGKGRWIPKEHLGQALQILCNPEPRVSSLPLCYAREGGGHWTQGMRWSPAPLAEP